jgi:translation initiation factor 2 subunit 1
MFVLKSGYPERSELVICTVTKIQFNSIFVKLDEYDRKQGIIHISEISAGRIRNIRDYVKEGKVIVCVVLRVSNERDLIELSLRRVQEGQRRKKINDMKQEQKAEKLIEFVATQTKTEKKELVDKILKAVSTEYNGVHSYFEEFVAGNEELSKLGLPKKVELVLEEAIKARIKPPEVIIKAILFLQSFQSNGIEIVKAALQEVKKVNPESIAIHFLGAGKFDIKIICEDYKTAEKILGDIENTVSKFMKKSQSDYTLERIDK